MELRNYIEMWSQDEALPQRDVIELGRKRLFDFPYPFFDEAYRPIFETNFIRTFYMKEIGFETEGLFKFQLETWLNVNMPYFNKLFESELFEYDPLTNSKMNVKHKKVTDTLENEEALKEKQQYQSGTSQTDGTMSGTGKSTENSQSDGTMSGTGKSTGTESQSGNTTTLKTDDDFNRELESNNPDSRLAITAYDGEGVIQYASNIKEKNTNNISNGSSNQHSNASSTVDNENQNTSHEEATSTVNNENQNTSHENSQMSNTTNDTQNEQVDKTINNVEDFIQERIGKIGVQSYPELIEKYRRSLLRIENDIFREMKQLFMMIY